MKAEEKIEVPGPVIWGYALAAPLFYFSSGPVWTPYWIIAALSWGLILRWLAQYLPAP